MGITKLTVMLCSAIELYNNVYHDVVWNNEKLANGTGLLSREYIAYK